MRKANNPAPETVLKRFEDSLNKYRFMESNLNQKKKRYVLSPVVHCCKGVFLLFIFYYSIQFITVLLQYRVLQWFICCHVVRCLSLCSD